VKGAARTQPARTTARSTDPDDTVEDLSRPGSARRRERSSSRGVQSLLVSVVAVAGNGPNRARISPPGCEVVCTFA
jgi:hypothetical protein